MKVTYARKSLNSRSGSRIALQIDVQAVSSEKSVRKTNAFSVFGRSFMGRDVVSNFARIEASPIDDIREIAILGSELLKKMPGRQTRTLKAVQQLVFKIIAIKPQRKNVGMI